MKVLVFGKTGQVARELQRCGNVTALGRKDADLTNPEDCARIITETDADIIINAAAYTAVDQAEAEPELARIINATTPTRMATAAAKRTIPFLHISSDYVFNGQGNKPFHPDTATAPLGIYGQTKRDGERGIIAANGPHVILRTSWVFSAHGNNFVKTMLRLGATQSHLNVVSDQIGGPTPAAGIAATLFTIARAFTIGLGRTGVYHYAGYPDTSWADFTRNIFKQVKIPVTVNNIPSSAYQTTARRPKNSRLDCNSLQTTYAIPRPDWRDGLGDVLSELAKTA